MIQQILHLLSLMGKKSISFSDFSMLLFSPYLKGFNEEKLSRSALDAHYRQQNRHHLSLNGLLQSSNIRALPSLHMIIKTVSEWGRE